MSDRFDDLPERVAEALREPVRFDAMFDARVMGAVRAAARERERPGVLSFLVRPRTVSIAPLTGLAAAAAFAGIVVLGSHALRSGTETAPRTAAVGTPALPTVHAAPAGADGNGGRVVQFVLVAPGATRVALVGDFNDWDSTATPLTRAGNEGVWAIGIPLAPGRHAYAFIVDGSTWMTDPAAPAAAADDFGMPNSVVTVAEVET